MDAGLWWAAAGVAVTIAAAVVAVWQLRLQILDRSEGRLHREQEAKSASVRGALPVTPPIGRLPHDVRGRDALLAELKRRLTGRRRRGGTWVLTGMGGGGKSTVALAVAEYARVRGWQVWWITATDNGSLVGGMLQVLGLLGAPASVTLPIREGEPAAAERAWEFIISSRLAGRRWLLIFDDADDPALLAAGRGRPADGTGWLRPDLRGMTIVTTRNRDGRMWGRWTRIRELEPLSDDVAASVLRDLVPSISEPAAELGRRLGGLPLALHLAGTYLASPFARWHSFSDYLQALEGQGLPGALAELDDPGAQARATVTRTWEISLDALTADGRAHCRLLLFLLSCFAAATPIPAELLEPGPLGPVLRQRGQSAVPEGTARTPERMRDSGLYGLAAVGLINVAMDPSAPGTRTATVHPVIADVSRSQMLTTVRREMRVVTATAVTLLHAACEHLDVRDPADWRVWRRLIPHTSALLAWAGGSLDEDNLASLVATAAISARALWRSGNPAAGESLARASLSAALRLGPDHPATLLARSQLAQVVALSRYAEAEQMLRSLLPDQQRVLGKDHRDSLASERVLARLTGLQGRYEDAERMYRRLLAYRHRLLGDRHRETLATRHGLAGMVERLGRYEEAESMFRALLDDQREILGAFLDRSEATLAGQPGIAPVEALMHTISDNASQ